MRHMRALGLEDVERCLALAERCGWPREAFKWRLLLTHGSGWGLDVDGVLAGAVIATHCGQAVTSIGLMLVDPALQGRGLGRQLMEHALHEAGSRTVRLFATPQGRLLYARLGFEVVGQVHKHLGVAAGASAAVEPLDAVALEAVLALDAEVFGGPRHALLSALLQAAEAVRVVRRAGRVVGYGLRWPCDGVSVVGPVVAPDEDAALELVQALACGVPGPCRVDVPAQWERLRAWATQVGLREALVSPLMVRGAPAVPGDASRMFAISMQAVG